jgi:predicted transcriptional regulator of viral defense system
MKNNTDRLKELLSAYNGIITSATVTGLGIPRYKLKEWVDAGAIARIDRGVYAGAESMEDDLFCLQYRYRKGIFSHSTALYLHNQTDRVPPLFTMTFPYGYHSSKIKGKGIRIVHTRYYDLGVMEITSPFGNKLTAYDRERTICDMFKDSYSDIQVINQGIKNYISGKQKNIPKLLKYAEILHIKPKIQSYLEILL